MVVDAAACIRNDSIKAINTAPLSAVERFNAIALAAKQPIAQEEVFTWIETFEGCIWLLLKSLMPLNKDARQVVAKLDWKTANGLVQMILTHAGWYGDDGDTAPAAEDPTDDAPATEDQPSAGDLASQS